MEDWSNKFEGIYVLVYVIPFNNKMVVDVGPILESEAMGAISQKKGKKRAKKDKTFKNLDKNVKRLKIFWKRESS